MTDKLAIGFLADILYIKGIICYEEYEDVMNAEKAGDLDVIVNKMLTDQYNVLRRGEAYVGLNK
jgi:hypothetical protein